MSSAIVELMSRLLVWQQAVMEIRCCGIPVLGVMILKDEVVDMSEY
jgi:hypothetical protein